MPLDTPVTSPEVPIVATPVLTLLHVPPGVASVNVVDEVGQIINDPVVPIAAGNGFTVTVLVAAQPVPDSV